MAGTPQRAWMYLRMTALGLVALFALQLFFTNISSEGPARVLPWMGGLSNVWALLVAFGLGALSWALCRAWQRTWGDFKAHRAGRKEEPAAETLRQAPPSAGRDREAEPGEPRTAAPPEPGRQDAADIWTSSDQEGEEPRPRE